MNPRWNGKLRCAEKDRLVYFFVPVRYGVVARESGSNTVGKNGGTPIALALVKCNPVNIQPHGLGSPNNNFARM